MTQPEGGITKESVQDFVNKLREFHNGLERDHQRILEVILNRAEAHTINRQGVKSSWGREAAWDNLYDVLTAPPGDDRDEAVWANDEF